MKMADKKVSDLLQDKRESWLASNVVGNAPLLMAVFANGVVLFADYRVYDVIYNMTGSWWKALSASLACAIPFVLWEIGWQYNHTTENWRLTSLLMAGLAFVTSIVLGVADYVGFTAEWAGLMLGGVVVLTGVHTVMGLLYYYNDPDVARKRRKAQANAKMLDQQMNADVATDLLRNGSQLLEAIRRLESQFGVDDVEKVLAILNGKRVEDKPEKQGKFKPANVLASETERAEQVQKVVSKPADPTKGTGK
jgi:hypothetical protein